MFKLLRYLIWFLPFFACAIGYYAVSFVFKSKTVCAPALVGTSLDKAVPILSAHNLNIRIVGTKSDADLPDGTIISQTPTAGLKIKENQTIYVFIAKKPAALIAPDLKAKTINAAEHIAHDLGIILKSYAIPCNTNADICIAQIPAPSEELENNTTIVYASAAYAKPVLMPNLKDMPVPEIISFLQLHGITPTIIHTHQELLAAHHQCINCTIIDQRPVAGSLVIMNPEKPLAIQLQVQ